MRRTLSILATCLFATCLIGQSPYRRWKNGPPTDPKFFPIGVWLQNPRNAAKFKALGINTFVGQWKGPTPQQLRDLSRQGLLVIGDHSKAAHRSKHVKSVVAWAQQDEPDNAQKQLVGYGPPVPPADIVRRYRQLRKTDPTRPVFLNFGQGVANDRWKGRGSRSGKLDDYPRYLQGADIVAFDIYPVTHPDKRIAGKLEYVAKGVQRLVEWGKGKKIVWTFIEASHVQGKVLPTGDQVRSEVWMALVHGSLGIVYFVHEWHPKFSEPGLLKYPQLGSAVTAINKRLLALAPVLNSPTDAKAVRVTCRNRKVRVATMLKRYRKKTYLFAVSMGADKTEASFTVRGLPRKTTAKVLDEDRQLQVSGGRFRDTFEGYAVHLYEIVGAKAR